MKLLSRKEFTYNVLERDGNKCVVCGRGDLPLDAHHIIERRLWSDGGWYLDNGATLCDDGENGCHYKAETTELSVEFIREKCGIVKAILPEYMYSDSTYDKWGNEFLSNGMRTIGPLFDDESVQKVLSKYLDNFTHYVKYGRTYHAPWSDGINDDDKVHKNMDFFEGKRVIVTVKMDGENTTIYNDYFHARSVDSRHHYTRNWAKSYAMNYIAPNLPFRWRLCAENLYAVHSIKYDNLPSYLLAFSLWDERNFCLSWDESVEYFNIMDIPYVEVLYDGIYDEAKIRGLYSNTKYDNMEGYVIRVADEFHYRDFNKAIAKFVRKDHVKSSKHWIKLREHPTNELKCGLTMGNISS